MTYIHLDTKIPGSFNFLGTFFSYKNHMVVFGKIEFILKSYQIKEIEQSFQILKNDLLYLIVMELNHIQFSENT